MSDAFSNQETQTMFEHIKDTQPQQLISDAKEIRQGYSGQQGLAAEIAAEYSQHFADKFTEQQLEKVQWEEIANALARL